MKHITTYISIALLLVLVGWGGFVLLKRQQQESQSSSTKVQITASFYPLAYLAESIGGDFVEVNNITPSGAEPHDFEPTARDIARLGSADIFLYNGGSFEPWVSGWNKGQFDRPQYVVDMVARLSAQGASLISEEGVSDPHIWLDPLVYAREAAIVRDVLIERDPVHEQVYRARAESLVRDLTLLDQEFRSGFLSCAIHDVIVSHDAFSYPAQRYEFGVVNVAGMSPDEEPSSQTLARIVDVARAKKIKHVFFETTVSPRLSSTIAREVGAETLVLHTLENLTPDEVQSGQDYFSIMKQNLANLRIARACN